MKVERWQLVQRQNYDLDLKIRFSKRAISDWYTYWGGQVYVAFSGGKDSTVLLHLVRSMYPNVPAVFVDTGLEYPEIRQFVKKTGNVIWLNPKMRFDEVIKKYGYPVVSKENAQKIFQIFSTNSTLLKNKRLYGDKRGNGKLPEKWKFLLEAPFKISNICCDKLKKEPTKEWEKVSSFKPITGIMASDSRLRQTSYLRRGCNSFDVNRPISTPIAFWKEEDIWNYIKVNSIPHSTIYNLGYTKTGCMFCMFGTHLEKPPNKFQLMKQTHPKQWDYCINDLNLKEPLEYLGISYN